MRSSLRLLLASFALAACAPKHDAKIATAAPQAQPNVDVGVEIDTQRVRPSSKQETTVQRPLEKDDEATTGKPREEHEGKDGEATKQKSSVRRAVAEDALDARSIQAIAAAHADAVEACYQKLLAKDPSAAGSLKLRVAIAANGAVSEARVVSSTIGSDDLASCVAAEAKRWTFPKSEHGIAPVLVPYAFSPS